MRVFSSWLLRKVQARMIFFSSTTQRNSFKILNAFYIHINVITSQKFINYCLLLNQLLEDGWDNNSVTHTSKSSRDFVFHSFSSWKHEKCDLRALNHEKCMKPTNWLRGIYLAYFLYNLTSRLKIAIDCI